MSVRLQEPVPRYRGYSGPAVLSQGFRPFFLLAGIWAALVLPLSVEMIQGRIPALKGIDPVAWHFHEMLFGYVAAVVAGFLLTAIPNWTGRLPLSGMPLLALVLAWGAGRAVFALGGLGGVFANPWWVGAVDLSFLAALLAVTVREIVHGRNWRNLPVLSILAVFLFSNALFHVEASGVPMPGDEGLAQRLAIAAVAMLIALIGGRVVPSFTRNALMKKNGARLPAGLSGYDRLTLVTTGIALLFWVLEPVGAATAIVLATAAALNVVRLARWRGWATYADPLLWVLHVGYAWLPLGLALLAMSSGGRGLAQGDAVHALTAGAMGTMTLAMMSRASLGHTGRPLHAGKALASAYLLVISAAALRVSAPLWGDAHGLALSAAMAAWVGGFALFVALFAPLLLKRRTI